MRLFAHRLFACFLILVSTTTSALERVAISLGTLEGMGWAAKDVVLVTDALFTSTATARLRVANLVLTGQDIAFSGLEIECRSFELAASRLVCGNGMLQVGKVLDMQLAGDISIDYAFSGDVAVNAGLDQFAGGRLSLSMSQRSGTSTVRVRGTGLDSAELRDLAGKVSTLPDYEIAGRIDFGLEYESGEKDSDVIRWRLSGREVSFGNDSGTHAGERIALASNGQATRISSGWRLNARANLQEGLLYIDPIYLDAGRQGVMVHAEGNWRSARRELGVTRLVYSHRDVLEGTAKARIRFFPSFAMSEYGVTVDEATFPAAYHTYVQPWVYGTMLADVDTQGMISGHVTGRGSRIGTFDINLSDVGVEDRRGRFALSGLDGNAGWADDDQMRPLDISWESGSLFRIALGATHLPLVVGRDSIALREPSRISVLGGTLEIDHWDLAHPGKRGMTWSFDGVLTPISLEAISAALGWPPFSGNLSGVIPDVRYEDELLTVGGVLLVRAFNGSLTVKDLSLEQPFGRVPRLSANIALNDLDLERVTDAFSFGKIEGRLGGYIDGLRLVNWQPVAFDARLATPPDDDSRHRISQKAIDDISNIGGGRVGNIVSSAILGFFKDFPYDRLGISCRLQNGVCQMSGVAPAPEGYYIVKGRLLPPRIDIVGYSDRVDWESLLARLKAAISSGGVTIQ